MELDIRATEVFEWNWEAKRRFVINCGGTRSGKTIAILQVLIVKALESTTPLIISIVRKTFPALKKSIYRDFVWVLEEMGLYDETMHNKSDNIYKLNGSTFEFFSIDNAQKYRGSKRNILYLNEANECTQEDVFQLQIRTTDQVFIDYNPSFEASWIYELEKKRKSEVDYFRSTYLNNPFLPQSLIDEIERLRETDADYWRIYGLGERGKAKDLIYQYELVDDIPVDRAKFLALGMDFGFTNDPTTILEVWEDGDALYVNELVYERGLTNDDIVERLREFEISRQVDIIADSAEPKSIEEIRRRGYRITGAKKGPDSIINGIDILKRKKLYITKESVNIINEISRYKWKVDPNGNTLNSPVDAWNHSMDALRYVALNMLGNKAQGKYNISIGRQGHITSKIQL